MAPALLCKISKNHQNCVTRGKSNEMKSKLACILEASEFTRLRMGECLPNRHQDHIAGKGENSLQHYNLVHKFIPMPKLSDKLAILLHVRYCSVDTELIDGNNHLENQLNIVCTAIEVH